MSNQINPAYTDCPKCKKPVVILKDEEPWQYVCPGVPGAPCGTAFEIKKEKPEDDDLGE